MAGHPAYDTYWQRKELLKRSRPTFPVRRWWETDGLCDIERVYFEAVREAPSLLDVGAGDLRVMRKLQAAGYRGEYHTQDVGTEGSYTYRGLDEVTRSYGAMLCLDVLEHLTLEDGLILLRRMISLLASNGALVIQTPNAAYLPNPLSWDMTHVQLYNVQDLWAFLTCEGMAVEGYRVLLAPERPGGVVAARTAITSYVKRKILGCDFANNIALVARKPR
ncbi:MAG TPA: methyltransferase domain-containing protein [Candidatus Eisenbacteria bacterium]